MNLAEIADGQWHPSVPRIGARVDRMECACTDPGRGDCGCEDDGSGAAELDESVRAGSASPARADGAGTVPTLGRSAAATELRVTSWARPDSVRTARPARGQAP